MPAEVYIGAPGSPPYLKNMLYGQPDLTGAAPPPPPTTGKLLVGSSQFGKDTLGSAPFNVGTYPSTLYPYQVHRTYDTAASMPNNYNGSAAKSDFSDGSISVWSYPWGSGRGAAVRDGNYDTAITNFINSIPSGNMSNGRKYEFYMVFDHEPEANGKGWNPAVHQAMLKHLTVLIRNAGRSSDVHCTLITTEGPFNSSGAGHPPENWYDYGNADSPYLWGVDCYNKWAMTAWQLGGHATPTFKCSGPPGVAPNTNIAGSAVGDTCLDYAQNGGKIYTKTSNGVHNGWPDESAAANYQCASGANTNPNTGLITAYNNWSSIADRFGNAIAWFDAHPNMFWGITESGCAEDRRPSPDPTYKNGAWVYAGMKYLAGKKKCKLFCYWDQNFGTDQSNNRRIDSSQEKINGFINAVTDFGVT